MAKLGTRQFKCVDCGHEQFIHWSSWYRRIDCRECGSWMEPDSVAAERDSQILERHKNSVLVGDIRTGKATSESRRVFAIRNLGGHGQHRRGHRAASRC